MVYLVSLCVCVYVCTCVHAAHFSKSEKNTRVYFAWIVAFLVCCIMNPRVFSFSLVGEKLVIKIGPGECTGIFSREKQWSIMKMFATLELFVCWKSKREYILYIGHSSIQRLKVLFISVRERLTVY